MPGHTFIATTGDGIARATQGRNDEWQVERLLSSTDVRCLAVDPLHYGRVYAGTQDAGVLRSDDAGQTWRPAGLAGQIVKALAVSPTQPGVLFAGTKPAGLFKSEDAGGTWREVRSFRRIPGRWYWFSPAEPPFIGYVQGIALSPTDAGRVAVGIEAGATVLSRDGGESWTGHRPGALRDCHTLTFHARRGEWLYEGGGTWRGRGQAVSRDGGRSWSSPREGLDYPYGWAVAADPERPAVWYLSAAPSPARAHSGNDAQAGIFRHDGTRWQRLSGGLPQPLASMPYALLTDPVAPGRVYAGLSNGDVWHSPDHGDHWQQLPFNLGAIHRAMIMLG
jgi:photosystem II stability/assembly factor-like uncharacterized protein